MTDPKQSARTSVRLEREITSLMQQFFMRLEPALTLSTDDEITIVTALQMAFVTGANAAKAKPTIDHWYLPSGDQWANDRAALSAAGTALTQ